MYASACKKGWRTFGLIIQNKVPQERGEDQMKKPFKWTAYGLGAVLLLIFIFIIRPILESNEQETIKTHAENYLAEHYQQLDYKIQSISSATKLSHYSRHHGYFKYAVNVQNLDTKETFQVFYDKKMDRMEDTIHIEKQEAYLKYEITPKIEKYVGKYFGDTHFIDVYYDMEDGEPMVLVAFEEHHKDITQAEFDAFLVFLKETVGLERGTVIVDYWYREVAFKTEL